MRVGEQSNKRPEKWVVVSCLLAMLGMENGNAEENEGNAMSLTWLVGLAC